MRGVLLGTNLVLGLYLILNPNPGSVGSVKMVKRC